MRFGKDKELEELKARIEQLETCVHMLVAVLTSSSSPMYRRFRSPDNYNWVPGIEPFITRYDQMTGRETRKGVGGR